jgi:Spy/CpxP family protein refolding chaperone
MKRLDTTRMFALVSMMFIALAVPLAFGQSKSAGTGTNGHSSTSTATAQSRGWQHGSPYGIAMRNAWNRLDLTTAQRDQIKNIRASERPEIRSLQKQIWSQRKELRTAFHNGTFSQSLATQKLEQMAPLQAKLMGERYKEHNAIMAVLTPQQRTELRQFQSQALSHVSKQSS